MLFSCLPRLEGFVGGFRRCLAWIVLVGVSTAARNFPDQIRCAGIAVTWRSGFPDETDGEIVA